MGFYDEIAKGVPWEISRNTDKYLKVVGGKLQLPHTGWLQYNLRYLDKVIEAIDVYKAGVLKGIDYDLSIIEKRVVNDPVEGLEILRDIRSKYKEFAIDIETANTLPCN